MRYLVTFSLIARVFAAQEEASPPQIVTVRSQVTLEERSAKAGHPPKIFWLTGLSGSGKSTLALSLERLLFDRNILTKSVDGDNLRSDLCADLTFSPGARTENIRRAGSVCEILRQSGFVVIASFISPILADREKLKQRFGADFHEIYVKASVEECVKRDPKGFYKKAMTGEIPNYTGIQASYEEPVLPNLVIDTEQMPLAECTALLLDYCLRAIR